MNTDMSREAISRRLNEFDQIWELCMALSKSRIVASRKRKEKKPSKDLRDKK